MMSEKRGPLPSLPKMLGDKSAISVLPKSTAEAKSMTVQFQGSLRRLESAEHDLSKLREKIRKNLSAEEIAKEFDDEEITDVRDAILKNGVPIKEPS